MRYSIHSPDYEYTLKSTASVGGKNIKEARNCGLVFADLTDRQVADKYNAQHLECQGHCHHSLVMGFGWKEVAQGIHDWIGGE